MVILSKVYAQNFLMDFGKKNPQTPPRTPLGPNNYTKNLIPTAGAVNSPYAVKISFRNPGESTLISDRVSGNTQPRSQYNTRLPFQAESRSTEIAPRSHPLA